MGFLPSKGLSTKVLFVSLETKEFGERERERDLFFNLKRLKKLFNLIINLQHFLADFGPDLVAYFELLLQQLIFDTNFFIVRFEEIK